MTEFNLFEEFALTACDLHTLFMKREILVKAWFLDWELLIELDLAADLLRVNLRELRSMIIENYSKSIVYKATYE